MKSFRENVANEASITKLTIQALTQVLEESKAPTMMGLQQEMRDAAESIKKDLVSFDSKQILKHLCGLEATCTLYLRIITREFIKLDKGNIEFKEIKSQLITKSLQLLNDAVDAENRICDESLRFLRDSKKILLHGLNNLSLSVLKNLKDNAKGVEVLVTVSSLEDLTTEQQEKLNFKTVLDRSVGVLMDEVDAVLVGSLGVCENGGIINTIGTFTIAVVASSLNVPVFVAAESMKFTRMFPLTQAESKLRLQEQIENTGLNEKNLVQTDFTPPGYIKLLFTDIGIFTPSAVSDELIRLYQ